MGNTTLKSVLFLIIGLIAGAGSVSLFNNSFFKEPPPVANIESPAVMKSESVELEAIYQSRLDSMGQTNTGLGRQVANTKYELREAKNEYKALQHLVDTLINQTAQTTDTAAKLAVYDSLQTTVQALIVVANQKDSLYEDLSIGLSAEVANKDSAMAVQREAYNALKLYFDNSLAQQDLLISQNFSYEQQIKKFKAKNKLLSAGMFVLSGIATYGLLRR